MRAKLAEKYIVDMDLAPYQGYKNLRQRLPIDNDNRPPVSLWAILKGSIGKDLTRIVRWDQSACREHELILALSSQSFPVFFNEPTSMLQRMSEDLEFSECRAFRSFSSALSALTCLLAVNSAAADEDPTKRIAFVAAFAMSNYSSTIGRIAKPFNPMLVSRELDCAVTIS